MHTCTNTNTHARARTHALTHSLLRTSLRATTGDAGGSDGRGGAADAEREAVVWARFDVSGRAGRAAVDGHRPLLILGYANGVQVEHTRTSTLQLPSCSRRALALCATRLFRSMCHLNVFLQCTRVRRDHVKATLSISRPPPALPGCTRHHRHTHAHTHAHTNTHTRTHAHTHTHTHARTHTYTHTHTLHVP